jgi:FlaA1/EpsC-like NDP-sugar epimerase
MDPKINYQLVGIIDNDPLMKGRQIHGVEVVGGIEELDSLIIDNKICGVIIASKDRTSDIQEKISDICRQRGCWLKSLRLELELME